MADDRISKLLTLDDLLATFAGVALRIPSSAKDAAEQYAAEDANAAARPLFVPTPETSDGADDDDAPVGYLFVASSATDLAPAASKVLGVTSTDDVAKATVSAVELRLAEIHCCSCTGLINELAADAAKDASNPIAAGLCARAPFDRAVFIASHESPIAARCVHDAAVKLVCDKAGKGAALALPPTLPSADLQLSVVSGCWKATVQTPEDFKPVREEVGRRGPLPQFPPASVPVCRALKVPSSRKEAAEAWADARPAADRCMLVSSGDAAANVYLFSADSESLSAAAPDILGNSHNRGTLVAAVELALQDIYCCSCVGYLNELCADAATSTGNPIVAGKTVKGAPFDRMVVVGKSAPSVLSARALHDAAVSIACDKAGKGAAVRTDDGCVVIDAGHAGLAAVPADFKLVRGLLRQTCRPFPAVTASLPKRRAMRLINAEVVKAANELVDALPADAKLQNRAAVIGSDAGPSYLTAATDKDLKELAVKLPEGASATDFGGVVELALQDIYCCSCVGYLNELCADAAGDSTTPIVAGACLRAPFDRLVVVSKGTSAATLTDLHDAAIALVCDKAGKGAAIAGSFSPDDLTVLDKGRVERAAARCELKALREELRARPLSAAATPTITSAARSRAASSAGGGAAAVAASTQLYDDQQQGHGGSARVGGGFTRELREFVVEGMTCASCAGKIEMALKRCPFVEAATVNFASCTASVTITDATVYGDADVLKVVSGLGFGATAISGPSPHSPGAGGAAADDDGAGGDAAKNATLQALKREGEIKGIRRRLVVAAVLTVPLVISMILTMAKVDTGMSKKLANSLTLENLLQALLSTPVVVWCGRPFFVRAWAGLKVRSLSMDTLVAFGVGGSYAFSVCAAIARAFVTGSHVRCYFDTAGTLLTFMLLGKFLEAYAKRETGDALVSLMSLTPPTAIVIDDDGTERTVNSGTIPRGAKVKVLVGARVPVDGVVLEGTTAIDESMVTGEPYPRERGVGDAVVGGTMNLTHGIVVEARRVGEDTMLANMFRIVRRAQSAKPSIQRVADRAASVFVPAVVTFAVLVFLVWTVLGQSHAYPSEWRAENESAEVFAFSFFLATIVVACPCALGLATPTAVMVGTGIGARHGVLVKAGEALERSPKVDCVLFDKTGTLTMGKFRIARVEWLNGEAVHSIDNGLDQQAMTAAVAAAEAGSTHPIATCLQKHCEGILPDGYVAKRIKPVGQVRVTAGGGVELDFKVLDAASSPTTSPPGSAADTPVHTIALGSVRFIEEIARSGSPNASRSPSSPTGPSVAFRDIPDAAIQKEYARGRTVVAGSLDGIPCALMSIEDTIKPDAASAIAHLRTVGTSSDVKTRRIVMVTGDNQSAARDVAARVGIRATDVYSQQLPQDKVRVVEELQAEGYTVAFVGDGINDSAALAQSHLGIALGAGTEVALDAADVVIVNSHLADIVTFFDLSATTMRRIRANFVWAIGYNVAMLPIASGMLYPLIKMQLPPVIAGMAMVCSSLSVLASSLALRCFTPEERVNYQTADEGAADRSMMGGSGGVRSSINSSMNTIGPNSPLDDVDDEHGRLV